MKVNGELLSNISNIYIFNSSEEQLIELHLNNDLNKMDQMFKNCLKLSYIDLSKIETNKITNMSEMFYECNSLTSINFSKFNTENVVNMSYLFMDACF